MSLAASLVVTGRSAPRRTVSMSATLRQSNTPIDITIENISTSGFLAICPAPLAVGDRVSVGAVGLGRVDAEVMWCKHPSYGCMFDRPVPQASVDVLREASNILPLPLESFRDLPPTHPANSPSGPVSGERPGALRTAIGMARSLGMASRATIAAIAEGMFGRRK